MELTLYHGTDLTSAKDIVKNYFILKANPEHWLGNGIYFYLDEALAKWWTTKPTKKYGCEIKKPAIVKTVISIDEKNILDLRQFDIYSSIAHEFERFFTGIYIPYHRNTINVAEIKCLFFDWYLFSHPNIKIIIGNFFSLEQSYMGSDEKNFYKHTNLLYGETQICLNKDCQDTIINKEVIEL